MWVPFLTLFAILTRLIYSTEPYGCSLEEQQRSVVLKLRKDFLSPRFGLVFVYLWKFWILHHVGILKIVWTVNISLQRLNVSQSHSLRTPEIVYVPLFTNRFTCYALAFYFLHIPWIGICTALKNNAANARRQRIAKTKLFRSRLH